MWLTKDIINFSDTTSLLILKNAEKIKDSREEYSHYFYKVEKVSKEKIKLTDLTGESRRNRVSVFEREF